MDIKEIKNSEFVKTLNTKELNELASDIRNFLLDSVSKTGGHLSSNLGVVELTIAMHYVFDCDKDKFLFDVGHQSYIHKILTGRAKDFDTLRQFNGLAGFQRRYESKYDCFEAGHSSTALSTALGMAIARDLKHEDFCVVPVVGDAALQSGLSLEALNQIGDLKSKVIIVFNDNNMSISKNVGALSKAFSNLRSNHEYIQVKDDVKSFLNSKKNGNVFIEAIKNIKESIKDKVIDSGIFEGFNIDYIGPVDGHNIKDLINVFEAAKKKDGPIVIHVVTKKGKGYKPAEEDKNGKWHGVGKFDVKTGEMLSSIPENYKTYSQIVADKVLEIMDRDDRVTAITPAMISGSCMNNMFAKYPKRCFDVGIAEDHAITFACGMALEGLRPFVSVYSSFLQRAYDQLNHDVCRMNLPVVIGVDRCSIIGEDGDSHQGVFDISYMNSLPNMVIAEGKNSGQIEALLDLAFSQASPFAIRYPRGSIEYNCDHKCDVTLGKWEFVVNNIDSKVSIITYGNDVCKIEKDINDNHLPYNLINALFIKPIDEESLVSIGKLNKPIVVYTNDIIKGGLGDSILECLNKNHINAPVYILGVDDIYVKHGSVLKVKESLGLDLNSLYRFIESIC